jgi:diacylglycerol O-acyltransferase / wax synthase
MPSHHDTNRLSYGDALFLFLEREGMPLNVASVNVFEGVIPFRTCVNFITSKLPSIPRYQQRVVSPAFNIGLPSWEFDAKFDIRNHVRHLTLTSGTDADFKAAAGKILSQMMDRQRPLWDFTLVHGLKGNRTGVITRMHHCMADGLAGVGLLNMLMDPSPEVPVLHKEKAPIHIPRRTHASTSLLNELITSSAAVAERVITAETELLTVLQQVLEATGNGVEPSNGHVQPHANGHGGELLSDLARFMPEVSGSTQPLPFNVICRGPQKFAWTEIPLAEIKAVKQACGATVNDVVLTLVASAIQRYVHKRGVQLRGRLLRIAVPVNMRGNGDVHELGNRITFLPVTVPLDIRNIRKLMTAIRERVAFLRTAHVPELVSMAGTVLGTIPTAAQVVMGPIVSQLPLGLSNTICTNVPGPASPLYLLGHKMLRCYPYVPIGGDIGINFAVLTYDGTACFGFIGDAQAAPDLWRMEKFLTTAFAELKTALRVGKPRAQRAHGKAPHAAANATPSASVSIPSQEVDPRPTSALEEKTSARAAGVAV